MVTDPVCKMLIDENKAAGKNRIQRQDVLFLRAECKAKFDANPQQYAK